ncbi:MAG: hypothetical protein WKG00_14090 [Polyangiaceae bacterium]
MEAPPAALDALSDAALRLGGDLQLAGHAMHDAPAQVAAAAARARASGRGAVDPERARQLLGLSPR